MLEYSIEYGPEIAPNKFAAYITGDCSKVRAGTMLRYRDGSVIKITAVGSMCGGFVANARNVLIEGAIDTKEHKVFITT